MAKLTSTVLNQKQNTNLIQIHNYLQKYRSITQWECYEAGMTTRLGARIYDLRKDYEQDIISLPEIRKNHLGKISQYARYVYRSDYQKWKTQNPKKSTRDAAEYFQKLNQVLHYQELSEEDLRQQIQNYQEQIKRCEYYLKTKTAPKEPTITQFHGRYAFLNNRYRAPFILNGIIYPTAETAYLALHSDNKSIQAKIARSTPEQARRILHNTKIRDNWEDIKIEVMEQILRAKFQQNPALKKQLILTRNRDLHPENHNHENFWESCTCSACQNLGENMLGELLMNERKFETEQYYAEQLTQPTT